MHTTDENLEVLREGCFAYFELGGECVGGPVRLLSGLAPEPLLLVYHFFRVALYSIYILFSTPRPGSTKPPSLLAWPALAYRSVLVFWTACVVLLPVVFTEMRSNVPTFKGTASAMGNAVQGSSKSKSDGRTFPTFFLLLAAGAAAWLYASPLNALTFPGALARST